MSAPHEQTLIPGLSRIRTGAEVVLRGVEHRAELAALEFDELRAHTTVASWLIGGGIACFFLAGFAATLLVAAIYWDTPHRVGALSWLVGVELLLGVGAIAWLCRCWRTWRPWSATREQLRRDVQCLHQIFQPPQN